jgi:polyhydroxybutyrate depolymerase
MAMRTQRLRCIFGAACVVLAACSTKSPSMQEQPNLNGMAGTAPTGDPLGGQGGGASGASGGASGTTAGTGGAGGQGGTMAPVGDADAAMSGASDSGSDASTPASDAAVDADQPVEITCPANALTPGDEAGTLMHDGLTREFLIHIPPSYDNTKPVPLVLNFHGATSNAEQQRSLFSLMDATSDDKGFIVVYPEGIGASWNAGACCGDAQAQNVDDVGFALALVEHMKSRACIDPARVYSTGFSNGGRMSYRLGCEAAHVFAAIAPVAGTKSFPDLENTPGCTPSRPLSLIDFMGSADSRIAAQPGQVEEWVAFNGCTDAEPTEVYRNGEHYCLAYSQCEAETSVTFCVVDGGGHCWPGSTPCVLGSTSTASELSANELMWEVFERSTL